MKNRTTTSIFFILLLVYGLFCAAPVLAADEASLNPVYNLGGSVRHSVVSGSNLYSLIGSRLYVHDITDLSNPVELGSMPIPGKGRRIDISGSVLFIACSKGGLVSVDISDPSSPKQTGATTFDTPERITNTFDVELHGSLAYVADYNGFFILDITDPAAVTIKGSFTAFESDNPHTYGVHVNGGYAYVCCELDGLYIFDIADPANIIMESHYSGSSENALHDQYYDSLLEGDYLYLAAGGDGVAILNVADVKNPAFVSAINNDYGGILGLVKYGNVVYPFSEFYDQVEIDVSDVNNPQQTEMFDVGGHHSLGISIYENYLILANATFGIRFFDISKGSLDQVGVIRTLGRVMDCQGSGTYAFAAAAQNGLKVLDMTDPSQPAVAATLELIGYANGLFVEGTTAYIAELSEEGGTGGLLEIVDITDPLAPVSLASVALEGEPLDVTVSNGIAYVACQTKGLSMVDVSVPSSPTLSAIFDSHGVCFKSAQWGDLIIGADAIDGFFIIDLQDNYPMTITGGYDVGNVQDIALWDSNIFLPGTLGEAGLAIYNIAQPYAPYAVGSIQSATARGETGQIKAVETFDSYLLVAESVGGLRLFDIADAANPLELAGTPGTIHGDPVQVTYNKEQGLVYVSSQIIGLYIYEVSVPDTPEISIDGRWLGSGVSDGMTVGIAAELDQARNSVTGTVTVFSDTTTQAAFTGSINGSSITGSLIPEMGPQMSVTLTYDAATGTITGSIPEGVAVSNIQLGYAGMRGYLDSTDNAEMLEAAVAARIASSDNFVEQWGLSTAKSFIDSALTQDSFARELAFLSIAEFLVPLVTQDAVVSAVDSYVYPSALWESSTVQAIARHLQEDICDDYAQEIDFFAGLADSAMDSAAAQAANGNYFAALLYYSSAVGNYERVTELYKTNKPNCPEWGIATLDGYYVGTVDFVGIISGTFKVCVEQDEQGNISGGTFIAIEASEEYMAGTITEATNSSETGISIVNGVFIIKMGERDIPLEIQEWKYNPNTAKWEGKIYIDLQEATGNITLEFVSDECPEGWNEQ